MNKVLTVTAGIVMAAGIAVGLSGCEPGYNVPGATAVGAGMGALLGSALFGGTEGAVVGTLGGALIGGALGNQIGQDMDREDEIEMEHAIVYTPIGEEASWTNPDREVTYVVSPVDEFYREGRYCRSYVTRIKVHHHWEKAYGKACRRHNGAWRIVR